MSVKSEQQASVNSAALRIIKMLSLRGVCTKDEIVELELVLDTLFIQGETQGINRSLDLLERK